MDKSVARGFTRKIIADMQTRDDINRVAAGTRGAMSVRVVADSLHRKFMDRSQKQFRSVLGKSFQNAEILINRGDEREALGMAVAFAAVQNAAMLRDAADDVPAFTENMVSISRWMVETGVNGMTVGRIRSDAAISQHAIQRLLQREAVSPDTLEQDLKKLLFRVEHVFHRAADADCHADMVRKTILVPFRGGAAVAALMPYKLDATESAEENVLHQLCVRTYLGSDMLDRRLYRKMTRLSRELDNLKISQMRGPAFDFGAETDREIESRRRHWRAIINDTARVWSPTGSQVA